MPHSPEVNPNACLICIKLSGGIPLDCSSFHELRNSRYRCRHRVLFLVLNVHMFDQEIAH